MNALFAPPAAIIDTLPLLWCDRITLARANRVLAPFYIGSIRDEAVALEARRYADHRTHKAIADACEAFLATVDDDGGEDELDELDALLVDDDADVIRLDDWWRDSHHAIRAGMGEPM